ncbi:MAG: amylo-alpha-1,6-glucosidase [Clostridia bacterium]|nr:amylo-alpha-1,6-glucosidase [Clostridia bacterium]
MKLGKGHWRTLDEGLRKEWVITNGLGGYAGSSITGAHNRKHQGMLIASIYPPIDRVMLLSKVCEEITVNNKKYPLYSNRQPGWTTDGYLTQQRFVYEELPSFLHQVQDILVTKTIAMEYGKNTTAIGYEIVNGNKPAALKLTPLFNYRSHHDVSERADLKFECSSRNGEISLIPEKNKDIEIKFFVSRGEIIKREDVYERDMEYVTEIETGMAAIDNHYKPYDIVIKLAPYEKTNVSIICSIEKDYPRDAFKVIEQAKQRIKGLKDKAGYEDELAQRLVQAADQFIVYRKSTGLKTVLAGLPWFTDWGRDTMIALTGLTLSTGRFDEARDILKTFAYYVKNGLVPNMFPDQGQDPLYNTVDASLWYFYAVERYLSYTGKDEDYAFIRDEIYPKLKEIIRAYEKGTDFSIYMDTDSLIHAGSGLDQVTWMDVRVGEWVVTPRHGKPVEINALWYNALKVMECLSGHYGEDSRPYSELSEKVKESFNKKFWNEERGCLYDVVDDYDPRIRPNQIWAVSLPYTMLPRDKEKKIVDTVFEHLYASYGLRSLSPEDPEYKGIYKGQLITRDGCYHQGTTWGFPLGGFISAYVKVHDASAESVAIARRLIEPIEDHLNDGCVGSIAEIFDGNEPVIPRGCYAQAWSVGEVLRAYTEDILAHENK